MATTAGAIVGGYVIYSGSLTAAASDDWVTLPPGRFSLDLSGTFSASVIVERRNKAGQVMPCTVAGASVTFTGKASEVLEEAEGAEYRVTIPNFTSGQVDWRIAWRRA